MSVPFSQIPGTLLLDPDVTLSAIRCWHVIYVETLGRPGWDLSYGQIAEKIGSKRRQTAIEAVTFLIDNGWLVRVRQQDGNGDPAPNLYAVCREPFVPWNAPSSALPSAPESTTGGALESTYQKNHYPDSARSAPTEPLSRPAKAKARATPIPVDYQPTQAIKDWTAENCPHIAAPYEWERFVAHALQSDRRVVRWEQAWRNWAIKAEQDAVTNRGRKNR